MITEDPICNEHPTAGERLFFSGTLTGSDVLRPIDISCFLPAIHKFTRHCARLEQSIIEWGEPKAKPTKHTHSDGLCELLGHEVPAAAPTSLPLAPVATSN